MNNKKVFLRYEYKDEILPYLEVIDFNMSMNKSAQLYHSFVASTGFSPSGINLSPNKTTVNFKIKDTEFNKQIIDSFLDPNSKNFYQSFKLKVLFFDDLIFDESNYDENFINEYYFQENIVENCMMDSIQLSDDDSIYPQISIVGY